MTVQEPPFDPVDGVKNYTRNFPHIQAPGAVFFVTFRVKSGNNLEDEDRTVILDAVRFHHTRKYFLYGSVIMPDHVHMIIKPFRKNDRGWYSLSEILHSIKSFTAKKIGQKNGSSCFLWDQDYYDTILDADEDIERVAQYIKNNPVKAGLIQADGIYPWVYAR